MSDGFHFTLSEITDAEIRRASRLLGLRENAFHGEDNADPRQELLKSVEQMDIAACPGSGKTTLLVAKLAILAEKWRYRTRGICVLSHTNAARDEIEKKLGNTSAGRRLLSYPHFIGTIHAFLNEFLALPFLRSVGHVATRFNTDISGDKIWRLSGYGRELPKYLYNKIKDDEHRKSAVRNAHFIGEDLDIELTAPNISLILSRKNASPAFTTINDWKCKVLKECYAAYEDTFAFAHRALKCHPFLVNSVRGRFPLLFNDEAQDNSEDQSAILKRIFMDEDNKIIRQRFGDANQAIFNFVGDKGAETDAFPEQAIKKDLPNSHRFGPTIARLADPLGLVPCGLNGCGPRKKKLASGAKEGRHTIFLFDEANITKVLDAYGELLLETFSDNELTEETFIAAAVGQVHKEKGDDHRPRHVGHYWTEYDPELAGRDPKPQTFVKYVLAGIAKAKMAGEVFMATEMIAEGILRLAGMARGGITIRQRKHCHRYVMQLLEGNTDVRKRYGQVLEKYAMNRESPTKKTWDDRRRGIVRRIAETAAKGSLVNPEAEAFLASPDEADAPVLPEAVPTMRDNVYRFRKDGREVAIHIGSIHSVKGKNHTATLVLETFWQGKKGRHNLELLSTWLDGEKSGGLDVGPQQQSRLKLHYVAMTRPTHVLCLAMKQSTYAKADGSLDEEVVQKLKDHGWCEIKCI